MKELIPQIFWEKYKKMLSSSEFEAFKEASLKPLRKSIRINTLKISVDDFKKEAKKLQWKLKPIPWCKNGFWIEREDRSEPLGKSLLHLLGYFYIQEASSMIPPEVLKPKKDDIILDMSSAPGSKTTQIAALMQNSGIIVANEPEGSRIKALHSNIERLGVANTLISQKDGRAFSEYFSNFFDKILLDAPCSGEGTIRKDSSALEHWNEKRVEVMSRLQKDLIAHAFMALKPGGEMVYSTCTLSPEEDEEVLEFLLETCEGNAELLPIELSHEILRQTQGLYPTRSENKQLKDSGILKIWPQTYDTEGFFIAKIKKNFPTESGNFQKNRRNSPFVPVSKGTISWIDTHLNEL
ncbi:NOL1/NOP2/sun family putative RNA methylase, partial [Candidatus Peregrinibacteria bacterium]|nr:NOL1/NOP2/sun family putative RNA methylase [Candidatus Peregrinibacteria bacterium]